MSGIDRKALNAACKEFKEHLYIPGKTSKDERVAIKAAIEAYLAAKPDCCPVSAPPAAEGANPFISIHDELSSPDDRLTGEETARSKS